MVTVDKLPLSVFIIACNEEDRIPYAIHSVKEWVSEIIVIDSGSKDQTIAVSESLGAKVVQHDWQGYGPQKVYGESLCTQDWVLNIDADEAITPALATEIQSLFADGATPACQAYHIPIRIMPRFASKLRWWYPSNDPIRLYRKGVAGFKDAYVHDSVVIHETAAGSKIGHLRHDMEHRCFRSYSHALEKINFYSTMQAEDMVNKNRIPSVWRILVEPVAAFVKAYLLRRYCLLGIDGIVESLIYSTARTLRLAKARERFLEIAKGNV